MTAEADTAGFRTFNNGLFERMRDMNRSRLERLRDIHRVDADFSSKLLFAKNPAEATALCGEWMARRLEAVTSEQQSFAIAWLGLISDAVNKPAPVASQDDPDVVIWQSKPER
ncbi:MAG: hypothetical protein JWO83_3073 [Caulobacteraceae bacterium]|jgi:23S rRNA-/tRNA-specific pseudouridylate synthase|nr:hypothetical protein [Caulobacteraceae bacterium]